MQVTEQAPAKINLYLKVTGKRPDGFHQIVTLMQTLELADELILTEQSQGINLDCDQPELGNGPENLAYRAAAMLADHAPGRGVHIALKKRVPWQAGLGGGSSDAAAVLRGLNRLWQMHWPVTKLSELAAQLGSDVPFFLADGLALATGRGDRIDRLSGCLNSEVLLLIPPFGLSTAAVYQAWRPTKYEGHGWQPVVQALQAKAYPHINRLLQNDLELPAFQLSPELAVVKQTVADAGYAALLSGSGSSLFVLLPRKSDADRVAPLVPAGYRLIKTRFCSGCSVSRE